MKKIWLLIVTVIYWNCNRMENKQNQTGDSISALGSYLEIKEVEKFYMKDNYYYKFMFSTDSSYKISWSNGVDEWKSNDEIDINLARKLIVEWQNDSFIILKAGTGPGTWINLVLPFQKHGKIKWIENGLYFDPSDNLLVSEQFQFSDTILVIENLLTNNRQFIIEKENPCKAILNSACIDSILIKKNELLFKWVTPYLGSDSIKSVKVKSIEINI